jgi:hypothetical protein
MRVYAKEQLLPSISSMYHRVGGTVGFRESTLRGLEQYDTLVSQLDNLGVPAEVTRAFCARFEPNSAFRKKILKSVPILQKLSVATAQSEYVLGLVYNGFDLLHEDIFDLQLSDFLKYCKKLGLSGVDIQFVVSCIPRFDAAII